MAQKIALTDIIINREARQRRELTGIDELAASIKLNGQIQPIVLDDNNQLIAGERRLTAIRQLGWSDILYVRLSSLDDEARERIELAENIERQELPWEDRCAAVARYYALRKKADLGDEAIAAELNMSRRNMAKFLLVNTEIVAQNPLVIKADKFSQAVGFAERQQGRAAAAEIEKITLAVGGPEVVQMLKEPETQPIISLTSSAPSATAPIFNVDFSEWAPSYSGPRFNFLHCDFPYGIKLNKQDGGAKKYFRGYDDAPDVYWNLIAVLGDNLERIVADSAHMIFWFSMQYYTDTKLALEQMGWTVNYMPLIWHKNDNTGVLPDPKRGPRYIYETAFFCSRGDRQIIQAVGNVFSAPVTKVTHMSEKNVTMLRHFFRMCVDKHTVMLDPTCGSGNSLVAAEAAGPEHMLGLELDSEFAESAARNFIAQTSGPLL